MEKRSKGVKEIVIATDPTRHLCPHQRRTLRLLDDDFGISLCDPLFPFKSKTVQPSWPLLEHYGAIAFDFGMKKGHSVITLNLFHFFPFWCEFCMCLLGILDSSSQSNIFPDESWGGLILAFCNYTTLTFEGTVHRTALSSDSRYKYEGFSKPPSGFIIFQKDSQICCRHGLLKGETLIKNN